jgi:hypothetical protein
MKTQRILIGLTVINLGLLMFQLTGMRSVEAVTPASGETASPAPVLRGSSLEIVDDQGRVRASIKIHEGDPKFKWPNGKIGYPETVMFRLIDPNGRPEVKSERRSKAAELDSLARPTLHMRCCRRKALMFY